MPRLGINTIDSIVVILVNISYVICTVNVAPVLCIELQLSMEVILEGEYKDWFEAFSVNQGWKRCTAGRPHVSSTFQLRHRQCC